jgi:hypothetical protein
LHGAITSAAWGLDDVSDYGSLGHDDTGRAFQRKTGSWNDCKHYAVFEVLMQELESQTVVKQEEMVVAQCKRVAEVLQKL